MNKKFKDFIDAGGVRQRIINSVINSGRRVELNVTPLSNGSFYKCEVCCTCKYFKIESEECILSYKEAKKRDKSLTNTAINYYTPVFIKKPTWFRCLWWKE